MNTQGSKHSFDTIDGKTNFSPSLWKQRRHFALQLLEQHACQRVIDFGCGQGSLLQELLNSPLFTRIAGLDISSSALAKAAATSKRSHVDTRMNRETQVQLDLYEGSLADADERFLDFDALTCLEVVEHLDPEVLDALPMTVFELYRPRLAIFSTPNAEFNVNFPELNYGTSESIYRHGDHRFEWKRDEFQQWANKIALQYGYLVTFSGVGTFTDDTEFGHCSQIAVFIRIGPFSNSIPVDRSYKHISTISYPTIQPGQMTIVPRIAQQQQAQSRGFVRGTSRKQECREIPRNYQIQVFEKACEKNILAVIDTGTGKTLIAIMLLRHMADSVYIRPFGIQDMSKLEAISNELPAYQAESQTEYQVHADMAIAAAVSNGLATNGLDNKMESRASCAIFLVPTVALVSQQATYIRSNSNLKTSKLWGGCLTGNVQLLIQILTADVWRKEVIDADVIVMTPELLRQAVVMKFIDMGDIHLLVFDECHHATGNHPYNAIMALVVASPLDSQPRIFGMTASPVNSKRGVDVSLEYIILM